MKDATGERAQRLGARQRKGMSVCRCLTCDGWSTRRIIPRCRLKTGCDRAVISDTFVRGAGVCALCVRGLCAGITGPMADGLRGALLRRAFVCDACSLMRASYG